MLVNVLDRRAIIPGLVALAQEKMLKGQHWGFIPARAGSKRFPEKNKALLGGVPLWKRSMNLCLPAFDRTIISTDDDDIAKAADCDVVKRPAHLSDGMTYRIDDVLLDFVNNNDEIPEYIHLVQCTSPFTNNEHLNLGKWTIVDPNVDSVQLVSVISNTQHAYSQRIIIEDGTMKFFLLQERNQFYNSQRKPAHYSFSGYVAIKTESLIKNDNIWGNNSIPIDGGSRCKVDIDKPSDLQYAEYLLRKDLTLH